LLQNTYRGYINHSGEIQQLRIDFDQGSSTGDFRIYIDEVKFLLSDPGNTIHVPVDQPTIQAGIDAASDGDTVLVADGIYTGYGNKNLNFNGKAIIVQSESGPDNCIIDCEGNGRGFYFSNAESENSVVSGFTIANGQTGFFGAGIYCQGSSPTITNCYIIENTADYGGGGIYCDFSSPTITNCLFRGNKVNRWIAGGSGGGIYCWESSPKINNCKFKENTADATGGGIYCCSKSSPTITNCSIIGNTTTLNWGGGIYCGSSSPVITNCTITGNNAATGGGGIFCASSSPSITNCTFSKNHAATGGGGIYGYAPPLPKLTNCILWGNTPDEIFIRTGTPTITYCDVQGGYEGEGNIDSGPLFVDAENGDYHLTASSPCIDAGTSEGAPNTDIDGVSRPQGAGYDIGAYEFVRKAMPWLQLLLFGD
jgi:parallel beta-helix repeat protein/predicted outer membrane repeat protein